MATKTKLNTTNPNRRSKKMANYLLAYTGGGMAATEAEREQAMAAWGQWFGKLGSAVVAPGNPVGASTSVSASGSNGGTASGLTGYSVIAADSLDAAAGLVTDCPIIAAGGKVDVYETIEVM
jgi:hypothetical protein